MIRLSLFSKEQLIYYTNLHKLMINVVQTYLSNFLFITLINDKTATIFQRAAHLLYYLHSLMINVVQTYLLNFEFIALINDKTATTFQKAAHLLY